MFLKSNAGRNNSGKITVRHRGGGAKRLYRKIDFRREKDGIKAKVVAIQYDPFRTAFIALLSYMDGEKRYILAPDGVEKDDILESGDKAEVKVGNTLPFSLIPVGSVVHCIELLPQKGGVLSRSAGTSAVLQGRSGSYVSVKLSSGEIRLIHASCKATLGQVSNFEHRNKVLGKAGASRWKGRRSTVRGSAMNAAYHPHGGGEGKAPVGQKHPRTPWGKPTIGYKTRKKNKNSEKFIVRHAKR